MFAPFAEFSPEWQAVSWAVEHGVTFEAIDLPLALAFGRLDDPAADAGHRGRAAARPARRPGRGRRRARPRTVVGGPRRAPRRRRAGVRRRRRGHGRRAGRDGHATVRRAARGPHAPPHPGRPRRPRRRRRRLRRLARPGPRSGAWPRRPPTPPPCAAARRSRWRSPGCRGRTVGSADPRATGPAWPAPAGTTTCSAIPAPRGCRASSSTPPTPCAATGCRRRPTTSSPPRDWPRRWPPSVAGRGSGWPRCSTPATPCSAGSRSSSTSSSSATPSARSRPRRRRSRWPATWRRAQRAVRLKPESTSRTIELDLRTPNGLRRSHLLHRLVALGVPWGALEEGRGSSGTFRETWRLTWEPELSVRVVELAGHGTTVEAAATSRLVERVLASGRLADVSAAVELALLADLPARRWRRPCAALGELAAHAPDVAELMDALGPLAGALRYGDVRGTDGGVAARRVRRARRARRRRAAAGGRRARRRRRAGPDRADERRPGRRWPSSTTRPATARCRWCWSGWPTVGGSTGWSRVGRRGCCTTPGAGRRPTSRPGSAGRSRRARRPPPARRSSRGSSPAAAPCCCTTSSC